MENQDVKQLMNTDDLAQYLQCSPGTIRNLRREHPEELPPSIQISKLRGPRWSWEDVVAWEKAQKEVQAEEDVRHD